MQTDTYLLREAVPADAAALAALKLETFRETFLEDFAIAYPPADLAVFEDESYGLPKVQAELADPTHATWVVETDGKLIAYAHVGPCKLPHPDVQPGELELYQIYLSRAAQGSGLGKRLLTTTMDYMGARSARIWLGVWSGNARALAFYSARGFEIVGEYGFRVGTWLDDERIMRRDVTGK